MPETVPSPFPEPKKRKNEPFIRPNRVKITAQTDENEKRCIDQSKPEAVITGPHMALHPEDESSVQKDFIQEMNTKSKW